VCVLLHLVSFHSTIIYSFALVADFEEERIFGIFLLRLKIERRRENTTTKNQIFIGKSKSFKGGWSKEVSLFYRSRRRQTCKLVGYTRVFLLLFGSEMHFFAFFTEW